MGQVTTRSVLLPVQEGFTSVVLAHRGGGHILHDTMCVSPPGHHGHLALLGEIQARGRMGDERKSLGLLHGGV